MSLKKKYIIKLIVVGDAGVGKTSLMHRFVHQRFNTQYKATIGADLLKKDCMIDDKFVTMQMWDTAGQERFQSLGVAFYRGSDACIMVYDITDPQSFRSLSSWREELITHTAPRPNAVFPFVLLGNKCDLEARRQVSKRLAQEWCTENGNIDYFETSAKTCDNVDQVFTHIARLALQNHAKSASSTKTVPQLDLANYDATTEKQEGGCC